MKLENQVVSLEIAKKLKELGVKQESLFYWFDYGHIAELNFIGHFGEYSGNKESKYSAFTVAELGEMLPTDYATRKLFTKQYCCYSDSDDSIEPEIADTEADARGKMLVYLLENKLMEVSK